MCARSFVRCGLGSSRPKLSISRHAASPRITPAHRIPACSNDSTADLSGVPYAVDASFDGAPRWKNFVPVAAASKNIRKITEPDFCNHVPRTLRRCTVIDGIRIDLTADELVRHLDERIRHHHDRATELERKAQRVADLETPNGDLEDEEPMMACWP